MKSLMNILKQKRGVTLIELLVVVVILGIIAAVAIPAVMSNQASTYENTNQQNLKIVQEAVERYKIDHGGKFPNRGDAQTSNALNNSTNANINFNKLTEKTTIAGKVDASGLVGPYLQAKPDVFDNDGTDRAGNWKLDSNGIVSLP